MSIRLKLKNSVVQDQTPDTSDLPEVGELAVNGNINSIGGFMRASNNTIVKIFGPGSVTTPTATTTVSGISELATSSETTTGTATNRVVTPAGLNAVTVAERTTSNTNYVAKAGSTLTGVLTMPNGSNSAPAINFGDSDSGIFGGTNTVSLAAGGTTRLTADTGVSVVGTLGVTGSMTLTGDLDVAADIRHIGDTNTRIRFPAADTVSVETAGGEALRVDSSRRLLIGTSTSRSVAAGQALLQIENTTTELLSIVNTANDNGGSVLAIGKTRNGAIVQNDDNLGRLAFYGDDGNDVDRAAADIMAAVDNTPGANDMPGRLIFRTTADGGSNPTERLRIDSTGKATFTEKVVIDGDGGSKYFAVGDNEDFKIYHDANGPTIFSDPNNQGVKFQAKNLNFTESTGNTTRFRINDDGHVDVIGNLDVGAGIDVTGSVNATTDITLASTTSGQKISITKDGTEAAQLGHIGTGNEGILILKDGGTNTIVLHGDAPSGASYFNAGNVGIGTTSPASLLNLSGASGACTLQLSRSNASANGNTYGNLKFTSDTSVDVARIRATRQSAANDALLAFDTASSGTLSERMRIDASGRLLLGTTTEGAANADELTVSTSTATGITIRSGSSHGGSLFFSDATSGTGEYAGYLQYDHATNYLAIGTDATERMRIDSSGNVGIGTANPAYILDVVGDGGGSFSASTNSTQGQLSIVGKNSSGGVSAISRIKSYPDGSSNQSHMAFETRNSSAAMVEAMRIASDGKVGIGTTSPSTTLTVSGTSDGVLNLDTSDSRGAFVRFGQGGSFHNMVGCADGLTSGDKEDLGVRAADNIIFSSGGSTERMRLDGSGNLGIGTSSPDGKLDVRGTIFVNGDGTGGRIFASSGNLSLSDGNGRQILRIDDPGASNSYSHIFDSNGRLGIGTTSPSNFLEIEGGSTTSTQVVVDGTGRYRGLEINENGTRKAYFHHDATDNKAILNTAEGILAFATGDTERMRIDGIGSVGIGTSSPALKLHVKGGIVDQTAVFDNAKTGDGEINYIGVRLDGGSKGVALFGHTGHTTVGSQAAWMGLGGDDVAGGTGVKVFRGGNVVMMQRLLLGISAGTNNVSGSDATFQISYAKTFRFGMHIRPSDNDTGGGQPVIFQNQAGTTIGSISATASAITYNATSDYRLKENDVAILDGITRLKKLRPIRFNWKTDVEKTQDGFFAHEVSEAVPEAVTGEKDGTQMQQMDNSKLVPLLVAAVQELIGRVEKLEAA